MPGFRRANSPLGQRCLRLCLRAPEPLVEQPIERAVAPDLDHRGVDVLQELAPLGEGDAVGVTPLDRLDQDQQRLKLLLHEAEQLARAAADTLSELEGLDEELDLCFAAKKEDLARDLVRRKLVAEKRLQVLQNQSAGIETQQQRLAGDIEEQSQQLASMKQKLELLVSSDNPLAGDFGPSDAIRNEDIEIALLREKQRRNKS